jgi:hypothetical protein
MPPQTTPGEGGLARSASPAPRAILLGQRLAREVGGTRGLGQLLDVARRSSSGSVDASAFHAVLQWLQRTMRPPALRWASSTT